MIWTRVRTCTLTGIAVAMVTIAAACGEDSSNGSGDPTSEGPSSTAAGTTVEPGEVLTFEQILEKDPSVTNTAEVTWGYMFEESGALSNFGQPVGDGLKMAVEEINAAGGFQVGDTIYTIRLAEYDTRSDIGETVAVTTQLIQDDGVNIIWGPAAIGDPEATAITQEQEVLHLCPCPQRELTSLASEDLAQNENRWAFQTLPAPSKFLPPGAESLAAEHPEYDTFATICVDSETGHDFCDFFGDAYEDAGFEHVAEEFFPVGTTDFNPFITNLKGSNPDIVLNFTDAGVAQFALLRASWEQDVGEYYIAVELPYETFEALVGEGIREKRVSAGAAPRGHAQYTSEDARVFFEDKYKVFLEGGDLPPAAFAALLAYDPVFMLIAAMQRAGTVDDTSAIAEALEQVHVDGYGEDDLFFDAQHTIVTGNDSCDVYQGTMTCQHHPAPARSDESD
jgi:branched-chain amino acid transport system substrate-binding protein